VVAIQKTEAILLNSKDIRETSSIVVFYTRDFGKIKGVIKGIRGPQAKSGYFLREFAKYDIVYYEKRNSDIYMITQCDLMEAYLDIADDLNRRLTAYYIVELVDKYTPLEDADPQLYKLMDWIFASTRGVKYLDRVIIFFQLKLLVCLGFFPQTDNCTHCSAPIGTSPYFSARLASLLCERCHCADMQAMALSRGAVASINKIRNQGLEQLGRFSITKDITKELKALFDSFITYHLGEHLKSYSFIRGAQEAGLV